jgi:hypothetical protein
LDASIVFGSHREDPSAIATCYGDAVKPVEVEVLHDEPKFGLAARRNLIVALWRDAPRVEWFRAIREVAWPHASGVPEGGGWINLIVSGTPRFSDEARREAAEVSKRDDLYTRGTAHVVTLPGLAGAATRAFLGTIFLLARSKTPTKVFATTADASQWLAPLLGAQWTPGEIVELCRICEETLGLEPQ